MFDNNSHHDNTSSQLDEESFLVRNGRRLAAVAFIALAGTAGVSGVASAKEGPADDGKHYAEIEMIEDALQQPQLAEPEYPKPTVPVYDGPYTIDTVPGALDPKIPGELIPGDGGGDEPGDDEPGDDVPGDEYPEYPDVEGETFERTGGEELAYTGSDSKLPLVGAGLVVAGGLAAGASVLSRRSRAEA
jgi:hypothetical protein